MSIERRVLRALLLSVVVLHAPSAAAQSFPPADAYAPLFCSGGPMVDPFRDQSGAQNERDIVGDPGAPAGLHAADDQFLYLMLRLDEDPAPGGKLRPFAWAFELDLDGTASTYEVLIALDGNTETIGLYSNTQTTLPDDPSDPPDEPVVQSYPFASHGRGSVATGSAYGGGDDFALELAVPWTDLVALGVDHTTPLGVWAVTSSNGNTLNGDLACHDGAAGSATLSAAVGAHTALDPLVDTDHDGYPDRVEIAGGSDPADAESVPAPGGPGSISGALVMQGAGGCAVAPGAVGAELGLALLLLAAVRWRASWRRR